VGSDVSRGSARGNGRATALRRQRRQVWDCRRPSSTSRAASRSCSRLRSRPWAPCSLGGLPALRVIAIGLPAPARSPSTRSTTCSTARSMRARLWSSSRECPRLDLDAASVDIPWRGPLGVQVSVRGSRDLPPSPCSAWSSVLGRPAVVRRRGDVGRLLLAALFDVLEVGALGCDGGLRRPRRLDGGGAAALDLPQPLPLPRLPGDRRHSIVLDLRIWRATRASTSGR
jgi:hypothetical protein